MTYLIEQNFEGTGFDNSESWVVYGGAGGIANPDYATAPLRGSQSLRMKDDSSEGTYAVTGFTAQTQIWGFFRLKVVDLPSAMYEILQTYDVQGGIEDPSYVEAHDMIWIYPDGRLRFQLEEGGGADGSTALSTGTTYCVWFYFDRRTANRSSGWIKLSTTPTIPETNEISWSGLTVSDAHMASSGVGFTMYHGGSYEYVVDQLIIADAAIGSLSDGASLSPSGLATGAVSLGAPGLTQAHGLTASGLAAGAPVPGSPALSVSGAWSLTPAGLASGAVALGTPGLSQAHGLTAGGLAGGAVALGTPGLSLAHGLTAGGLASGAVTLGAPTLSTVGAGSLLPNSLASGAVSLGSPGLTQRHALTPSGLAMGQPVFGAVGLARPAAADRTLVVEWEMRRLEVGAEGRSYEVRGEGRVLFVKR